MNSERYLLKSYAASLPESSVASFALSDAKSDEQSFDLSFHGSS
jgi:hypothetical protein